MTAQEQAAGGGRRITPADVRNVQFPRGTLLHPGYAETEVRRFLTRVGDELGRLVTEKAELREQVRALQEQVRGHVAPVPPSEQAMRIIMTAQQTADSYVAEAEDFSQQMTRDARAQYEEQMRQARESAGAIIQAAQEAAASMAGDAPVERAETDQVGTAELEEEVAYLRAFGQAVRVQLRAYLEALLTDVETEWGQAHPQALPPMPIRTPSRRAETAAQQGGAALNVAADVPPDDSRDDGRDDALPTAGRSRS